MSTRASRFIIPLSLITAVAVWMIDAALDRASTPEAPFTHMLFHDTSSHEMYARIVFALIPVIMGIVFWRLVLHLERTNDDKNSLLAAISRSDNGIAFTDPEDRYVFINEAYARLYQYSPAELLGKTCLELVPPDLVSHSEHVLKNVLRDKDIGIYNAEITALRKNGTTLPVEIRATAFWDEDGQYSGHSCIVHDISEQKKDKEKIEQSARFLDTIFHSIRDPFIILDKNYTIVRANAAYAELKHIPVTELVDHTCHEVTRGRKTVCEGCIVAKTFQSGDPSAKEKMIATRIGTEEWIEIFTYPILNEGGEVTHVIEYIRDITDRKRADEQRQLFIRELETLSSVDTLTGLLNRRMIFDRLRHEIERVRRYNVDLALLFCDLDAFKEINDTHGHSVGDEVLKMIADVLRNTLRTSDIIGRYGGDEFIVVLPQTSLAGAHDLAERIRKSVEEVTHHMLDGYRVGTTVSIGVTHYAGGATDVDALLNRIDTALYVSKRSGKNQVYSLP